MFSRAKRFEEKPVGCGADAAYNPKDGSKPIGGVIPKVDRFAELKLAASIKSDTESVHSDKSSQVFRTPKAVRRAPPNSVHKKFGYGEYSESLIKDLLEAKNVEIRNKNETIVDYENQMKELKEKINLLQGECKKLMNNCENVPEVDIYQTETAKQCSDVETCSACQDMTLLIEKFNAIEVENQMLQDEINLLKSSEQRLLDLEVQYEILKDEHLMLSNILCEFGNNCKISIDANCMPDTSTVAKLQFVIEEFVKKCDEIKSLNSSLSLLKCEVKTLQNTVTNKDMELQYIMSLKEKIVELETKVNELNDNDEKRSLDILAMSDVINNNEIICRELNDMVEEKVCQIKELMESISLIKSHHALALEANESIRHEYKLEIDSLKLKHNEELILLENQYEVQLNLEKVKYFDEIKKNQELADCELSRKDEECELKIAHIEENAIEKIRICEIQFEERYKQLQLDFVAQVNEEKQIKLRELRECQNTIDREITKFELEIYELKNVIDENNKELEILCSNIEVLQANCDKKDSLLAKMEAELQDSQNMEEIKKIDHEKCLEDLQNEINKINKEKMKFSVTLETMRQTIEVLGTRLRNSDEDVENLKVKLDDATSLNESYDIQISSLKKEYNDFKKEYNELLTTIVESKSILDQRHQDILKENSHLVESLNILETEMKDSICVLKDDLLNDIGQFRKQAENIINDLQSKIDEEHKKFLEIKLHCDFAFDKINECQLLLSTAETQIEMKDQELNELSTENVRLSGTLVALEQEKGELEVLLDEFVKLSEDKDKRIHYLLKTSQNHEETIFDYEERIKKLTQFLEATEFIIKEKDNDISKYKDDNVKLSNDIDNLNLKHSKELLEYTELTETLRAENVSHNEKCTRLDNDIIKSKKENQDLEIMLKQLKEKLHKRDCEISTLKTEVTETQNRANLWDEEALRKHCKNLELELEEMTNKYTNLLGHQNNKQKIKHVIDLKTQNTTLKEENEKLTHTVEKQHALIEKLKKEVADANRIKSPLILKKQYLQNNSGKENVSNSFTQSPNRLGSPKPLAERPLTPLKDSNR